MGGKNVHWKLYTLLLGTIKTHLLTAVQSFLYKVLLCHCKKFLISKTLKNYSRKKLGKVPLHAFLVHK